MTRVSSLKKIKQTGSITINKSLVDNKSGYTVESRTGSRPRSRPESRTGSINRWESSLWTEKEDDNGKE